MTTNTVFQDAAKAKKESDRLEALAKEQKQKQADIEVRRANLTDELAEAHLKETLRERTSTARQAVNDSAKAFDNAVLTGGNTLKAWLAYIDAQADYKAEQKADGSYYARQRQDRLYDATRERIQVWNQTLRQFEATHASVKLTNAQSNQLAAINDKINEYAAEIGSPYRRASDTAYTVSTSHFKVYESNAPHPVTDLNILNYHDAIQKVLDKHADDALSKALQARSGRTFAAIAEEVEDLLSEEE